MAIDKLNSDNLNFTSNNIKGIQKKSQKKEFRYSNI